MCALVLALRKVPIYAPGAGGLPLGDPGNPSYSVAVSDLIASDSRDKAAENKEAKRLNPTKTSGSSTSVDLSKDPTAPAVTVASEQQAAGALNARNPTSDAARDDWGSKDEISTLGSREDGAEVVGSNDVEDLRQGLLKRESTRGRRKPGESIPPPINSGGPSVGPGLIITQPSPTRSETFDEEAGMGLGIHGPTDNTPYNGAGYGSGSGNGSGNGTTYSMFPSRQQAPLGSQQMQSAPAATGSNVPPRGGYPNPNLNR